MSTDPICQHYSTSQVRHLDDRYPWRKYVYASTNSVRLRRRTSAKTMAHLSKVSKMKQQQEFAEFKYQLMTDLNHEIRTPLTVILSAAELLNNNGEEDYQKFLSLIEQSVFQIVDVLAQRTNTA